MLSVTAFTGGAHACRNDPLAWMTDHSPEPVRALGRDCQAEEACSRAARQGTKLRRPEWGGSEGGSEGPSSGAGRADLLDAGASQRTIVHHVEGIEEAP